MPYALTIGIPISSKNLLTSGRIGAPPERISTVGDDPKEDGVLPLSAGAGRAFILRREKDEVSFPDSRMIPVENALQIPDFFKEKE